MKKTFRNVLAAGFILMSFIFASCASTKAESAVEKAANNKENKNCDYVEIVEDTKFLHTDIKYPLFDNEQELSRTIKNSVENDWKSFKSMAEEEWNKIYELNSELPPFEYIVQSAVSKSGNIISVFLNTYRFTGGAHGETFIKTFNFDTKENKLLNITEVSGYTFEELSDLSRKYLHNKLISENKFEITGEEVNLLTEMIEEGTLPIAGNFQNFTVEGNKLYIYFEQYKVAPYSYGIQVVELDI